MLTKVPKASTIPMPIEDTKLTAASKTGTSLLRVGRKLSNLAAKNPRRILPMKFLNHPSIPTLGIDGLFFSDGFFNS